MSSITSLSSATQSLLPLNVHPHGHRHGGHVKSTDSTDGSASDAAAPPVPAGTQQSLFGTLLTSLEQVIGLQPAATVPAAAATSAGGNASGSTGTTAATANTAATNAGNTATLLKNYLNNLSQSVNGSTAAQAVGVHINA